MSHPNRPAAAPAKEPGAPTLPVLLARRQGVAFVATARAFESLRVPLRYWGADAGVVPIPTSDEEIRAAEIGPPAEAGTWPRVVARPDLLAPALARLLSGEHRELSLQPSRDGLKASLVTDHQEELPFPIAPKDALGVLAAVLQQAPRGVVRTGTTRPPSVLLSVCPAVRRHEYRMRIAAAVTSGGPATLSDVGLSPAVLEMLLESLERRAALLLVSGGPSSGRSATLELLAATLLARGRAGARIGAQHRAARTDLPWLADAVGDWPFPESLHADAPEFVLVDHLEGPADLPLLARLAASGALVLAGAPPAEPEALARRAALDLESAAAPAVAITVLGQALLRVVCRGCVTWTALPADRARRLGFHRRDVEEIERRGGLPIASGRGCNDCAGTGAHGLTGAFELYGPDGTMGSLPRLREEGFRKAAQGIVCLEDAACLPGAHRPMRTLREVTVHAGASAAGLDAGPAETRAEAEEAPAGRPARRPRAARAGGAPVPAGATLAAEAEALGRHLREARAGRAAGGRAIEDLAQAIAARAAGGDALHPLLAPAAGFRLAAHSVNTALIAARVASALAPDADPRSTALLGLLHDAGLVAAGIDPDSDLPPVLFEESLDPANARLAPGDILRALGVTEPHLEDLIVQVHGLLRLNPPPPAERGRSDARAQAVALASLIDLHFRGSAEARFADLHDVTPLVMEQHGRRFPPGVFRALLRAIPVFPIGALVELSSGDLARVVSLNEDNHFRPRVEIAAAPGGEGIGEKRVVDLARAPFLHIRHRVTGAQPVAARAS
jgi:hypothetical protein